jgi:hypothetical protein
LAAKAGSSNSEFCKSLEIESASLVKEAVQLIMPTEKICLLCNFVNSIRIENITLKSGFWNSVGSRKDVLLVIRPSEIIHQALLKNRELLTEPTFLRTRRLEQ